MAPTGDPADDSASAIISGRPATTDDGLVRMRNVSERADGQELLDAGCYGATGDICRSCGRLIEVSRPAG
jgi:hypothetical protein